MFYEIDGKKYNVEIIRKKNKNTYIRVRNNNTILITTNYFATEKSIRKLLAMNQISIKKMIEKCVKRLEKNDKFYYLGKCYDIIISANQKEILIDEDKIYVGNIKKLNEWLRSNTIILFNNRLENMYSLMDEKIEYPQLKIRKMKSRWGVCNRVKNTITLNIDLIRYNLDVIDYVIIHELCHFIQFNHSRDFWNLVEKYCPNYKIIRKSLRE